MILQVQKFRVFSGLTSRSLSAERKNTRLKRPTPSIHTYSSACPKDIQYCALNDGDAQKLHRDEASVSPSKQATSSGWCPNNHLAPVSHGSPAITTRPGAFESHRRLKSSFNCFFSRHLSDVPAGRSKKDLLALVGLSDQDEWDTEFTQFFNDVIKASSKLGRCGAQVPGSDWPADAGNPRFGETATIGKKEQALVNRLAECLHVARTKPELFRPHEAFKIYMSLPEPRMLHISGALRHTLMRHMVERPKTHQGMLRYLSLVTDIHDCRFALLTDEWNTAMAFAGQYAGSISNVEVDAVLKLWREMEGTSTIKANEVTFNILFDVSTKAGNFTLSELLLKEMAARGLPFNRYHHVSLIHHYGCKGSSRGVRAAYRLMVESEEMIDSTVLNCVLSSLLKCGEEDAAEFLYEGMKKMHPNKVTLPTKDYFSARVVTGALMMFAQLAQRNPEYSSALQAASPIAPDLQTYRILVNHYSVKAGDLAKVTKHLDEMIHFNVPLHGSIFLALFKGFYAHGGSNFSPWNAMRLDSVFKALLANYDAGDRGLYINHWMVMWAMKAYAKCFRNKEKLAEVYVELKRRCENCSIDKLAQIWRKTLNNM